MVLETPFSLMQPVVNGTAMERLREGKTIKWSEKTQPDHWADIANLFG